MIMPSRPIGRRTALLGLTASFTLGRASLALAHAPTDRRFVVVILRGALDGLAAVAPYGDPDLAGWRGVLVPGAVGTPGGMLDLGGFYGLHPALAGWHDLYAAADLLIVHAVAGHYRSRSHFEAQDCLESGADQRMTSGWLNRVASVLPATSRRNPAGAAALSLGISLPLLLHGAAPVGSWAPPSGPRPPAQLYAQISALNAADRVIGPALQAGLRARGFADSVMEAVPPFGAPKPEPFVTLCGACGTLLAADIGPRLAALEIGGWDTHVQQAGRLNAPLRQLSDGVLALKTGLGPAWRQTVVLVVTEFGRTVRVNGDAGTDHGTGTVAFVLGGPVAGGRVAGAWPGLARHDLLDDRDLQPTTDLRMIAKGVLTGHLGLGRAALATVFPDSEAAIPMPGLLRA